MFFTRKIESDFKPQQLSFSQQRAASTSPSPELTTFDG
jgi:hypothetical protein